MQLSTLLRRKARTAARPSSDGEQKTPRFRLTSPTKRQIESAITPLEVEIQISFATWCWRMGVRYPELRQGFHIPNGEDRHAAVGKKLVAMGVKSGVPDWFLPVARGGYHGFFIEFKRPGGGKPSPKQVLWLEYLEAAGYLVRVYRDWEVAAKATIAYLQGEIVREVSLAYDPHDGYDGLSG